MEIVSPSKIEYKKDSLNLIADSLSWLRMDKHYFQNTLLKYSEPRKLEVKSEVNMVQTHTKTAKQENVRLKLSELLIKVQDILKTSDKHQLILNVDKVLETLTPVTLQELQDKDQSIYNLKNLQLKETN